MTGKQKRLRIDAHVHLVAIDQKNHKSFLSREKRNKFGFRLLRWLVGVPDSATDEEFDIAYADRLALQISQAKYLDKAVVFAMEGLYDSNGKLDPRTEAVISNDWAIETVRRHPDEFLFGAAIHPGRPDAIDELDRCAEMGAVCVKWVPPSQNIDPSDSRYEKFYMRMKKHGLVLTSHTGYEHTILVTDQTLGDPARLRLPLETGLKVVAGHAGTSGFYHRIEYFPNFVRLVNEFDNLYGDTSAITGFLRGPYVKRLLNTPNVLGRLIQGTDYPVPGQPIAWPHVIGPITALKLQFNRNPFDQDYLAKKAAGFPEEHFYRGHDVFLG